MKNCLVTKLLGVVNNDSLEKLGCFCINILEAKTAYFCTLVPYSGDTYIKIINPTENDYFTAGLKNQTGNMTEGYLNTSTQYVGFTITCGANTKVEISNKYQIKNVVMGFQYYAPTFSTNRRMV